MISCSLLKIVFTSLEPFSGLFTLSFPVKLVKANTLIKIFYDMQFIIRKSHK